MKILLIEDDKQTARFIKKGMLQEGFVVDHSPDGQEGLNKALTDEYEVLIVDIMLPKMDGLTLIENLRSVKIRTPVLILSAKRTVDDRVKGLQSGSDDYLVKPFAFSELLARIQALIRRSRNISEPSKLKIGNLLLDSMRQKVFVNDKEIILQNREFSLLKYLMINAGRVVSKTMIMENVWDYNFDPQTNVVEARICKLRDKINKHNDCKYIHTIRGAGYVFEETD